MRILARRTSHSRSMLRDLKDLGGGGLIASVKDAGGNIIGLI
jgi:hypothetical protein